MHENSPKPAKGQDKNPPDDLAVTAVFRPELPKKYQSGRLIE